MKIGIVACLHGDEQFGLKVLRHLQPDPQIVGVIANPKALNLNRRSVNDDLNRCFSGTPHVYEKTRTYEILRQLKDVDYVIDIHNTTSTVKSAIIVTSLNTKVRQIINGHASQQIIVMSKKFADASLIGKFSDRAVSLEYSFDYAQSDQALSEIHNLVRALQQDYIHRPFSRDIYYVNNTIPLKVDLPPGDLNYSYVSALNGYAFLTGEKAYIGKHQGFLATKKVTMTV